jgi:hypothetical protein
VPIYVSASSRLHALFAGLAELEPSRPLREGWSHVLGIPTDDVQFGLLGLPKVAELVSSASTEAERAEELVGLPLRQALVNEWSTPVYTPGGHLDLTMEQHRVSPEALTYLHSVASVLRRTENHQAVPDGDQILELLAQIDDLVASVEASTELSDDVKRALLLRIAQVRFAVENARVGGSEGVHEAVELLVGATAVRGKFIPKSTASKVFALAGVAYAVFAAGPTIQASLEGPVLGSVSGAAR